jgi:GNAT superfamily N-acetyltransferase
MGEEWRRGEFVISTDPARLDIDTVHGYISGESYWGKGRPREVVERGIANSLVFGLYHEPSGKQAGFVRVVTDRATFAWVCDVFVLEPYRGQGLSKWLLATMLAHPELQGLRRWILATRDAHTLYEQFGFVRFDEETRQRFLGRLQPYPQPQEASS